METLNTKLTENYQKQGNNKQDGKSCSAWWCGMYERNKAIEWMSILKEILPSVAQNYSGRRILGAVSLI